MASESRRSREKPTEVDVFSGSLESTGRETLGAEMFSFTVSLRPDDCLSMAARLQPLAIALSVGLANSGAPESMKPNGA